MKKTLLLVAVVVMASLLTTSCVERSRVGDFTIISTKNVSTLEGAQKIGVFEGKDCKTPGASFPSQEEAIDQALAAGDGNVMMDAVVYFKPAACIFDTVCWEVKGTVYKTPDMSDLKNKSEVLPSDKYEKKLYTSKSGREYIFLRDKNKIELDNDQKHYDLIVRTK